MLFSVRDLVLASKLIKVEVHRTDRASGEHLRLLTWGLLLREEIVPNGLHRRLLARLSGNLVVWRPRRNLSLWRWDLSLKLLWVSIRKLLIDPLHELHGALYYLLSRSVRARK